MPKKNETDQWDKKSSERSDINYVLGEHMGNPFNNIKNPNWRNEILETGYRSSMLNDPLRVEKQNEVDDNNYNKELMKDYPINPS